MRPAFSLRLKDIPVLLNMAIASFGMFMGHTAVGYMGLLILLFEGFRNIEDAIARTKQ